MKTVLITVISGQDGACLAKLLLKKNCKVIELKSEKRVRN